MKAVGRFICVVAVLSAAAGTALGQAASQPDDRAALAARVEQLAARVADLENHVRYLHEQLAHTQLMALAADTDIRLLPAPPPLAATLARLSARPAVAVDHASAQALLGSMVRIAQARDAAAVYELLAPADRDAVRNFDRVSLQAWHNYYEAVRLILLNHHEQAKRIRLTYWVRMTLFADDFLRRMDPKASFKVVSAARGPGGALKLTVRDRDGAPFEMTLATDSDGRVYQPMPATIGLAGAARVTATAEFIRDYFGRLARELADGDIHAGNFAEVMAERANLFAEKMKSLQAPPAPPPPAS